MLTLKKVGPRWFAPFFPTSVFRDVIGAWLMAVLIMLIVLAVIPSKRDETGAPDVLITASPIPHGMPHEGRTEAMLPCEEQTTDTNAVAAHARAYPAREVEDC